MQRRFRGPPTAAIVVAVAIFEVVGTVFASARQPDHRPLDALAFVLLLAGPAALALRRRAPLVMLPAAAVSVGAYLALGYAWGPVFLSPALAIVLSAAAGVPHLVKAEDLKPGAIVLDVGVSRVDDGTGKAVVTGDVHPDAADVAAWLSPNPGGVGPMTRAMLLANVVETAERQAGIA